MIAVKWRSDFPSWPAKARFNVSTLPVEFDVLLSQAEYDQMILDNKASFDTFIESQKPIPGIEIFGLLRAKWQNIADRFALENSQMGISGKGKTKQVADAFKDVVYYLQVNAPTEAIKALDTIPRDPEFITNDRINAMKTELQEYLTQITGG